MKDNDDALQPWITITLASASPRRMELLAQIGVTAEARPTHADEDSITLEQLRAEGLDGTELVAELARRRAQLKIAGALPAPGAPLILAADTIVSLDGELLEKPTDAADARRMLTLLSGRTHLVHTAVALRVMATPDANPYGLSPGAAPEAITQSLGPGAAPEAASQSLGLGLGRAPGAISQSLGLSPSPAPGAPGFSPSPAPGAPTHGASPPPAPDADSQRSGPAPPAPDANSNGLGPGPTLEDVVCTRVTFAPLTRGEIEAYIATGEWRGVAGGYRIQGRAGAFVTHLEGSYGAVVGLPIGRVYSMIKRLSGMAGFAQGAYPAGESKFPSV